MKIGLRGFVQNGFHWSMAIAMGACLAFWPAQASMAPPVAQAVSSGGGGGESVDGCDDDRGSLERQIAACTWLLNSLEMKIDAYKAAHFNRGDAYSFQGKFDQAIRDYGDAIQLQPKSAAVYLSRAYAYVYTARYSLAVRDYEFTIDLLPLDDVAYNDLAWLLATAPSPAVRDGARAVTLAQRAVQLNNTASNVDTLASAYARDGQFEDAALAQESAIALLLAEGGALYLLDGYQVRLRMFHARQPYDESMQ